ncbi:MAG: hypothetical protein NG712_06095 [Omnitrophica bacterium]|nr:hypothetical protein [Candidatus Omnitrophota bacterium]
MTGKDFMNRVANGKDDFLQSFVDILNRGKIAFCAIGGLAVNAYVEPVVSLDLDVVIISEKLDSLISKLKEKYIVQTFSNSINVSEASSDLRIQIQTDSRYQSFLKRASDKDVLGYKIPVACIEDVFTGKVWAAEDKTRRPSKRQKDLADIMRLIETKEDLLKLLPERLKKQLYPHT